VIIEQAASEVRASYNTVPDPDRLLHERFTVLELRQLHEAVSGRKLQRDTFRRQMEPLLVGTGEMTTGTRGRPAELYVRRGQPGRGTESAVRRVGDRRRRNRFESVADIGH
jgi:8-oxo-dGTP diphosphatase